MGYESRRFFDNRETGALYQSNLCCRCKRIDMINRMNFEIALTINNAVYPGTVGSFDY